MVMTTLSAPGSTVMDPRLFMRLMPETGQLFSIMNPVFTSGGGLVVQFIGAHHNEGVSTIARDFALTAAQYVDGSVLLLDFDWGRDSHFAYFQEVLRQSGRALALAELEKTLELDIDLTPMVRLPGQPLVEPLFSFHALPDTRLLFGRPHAGLGSTPELTPCILNRPDCWAALRQKAMLTVVDSPPGSQFFDGIVASSAMDAVLLVVRAESTRMPVVENLRDRLISYGAPLAGLVLNQRRFYIPNWIYRLMGRM